MSSLHRAERLILAHLWTSFASFGAAAVLGFWQMWVRSPIPAPFNTPSRYFASVTAHGTTMAYAVTTFFAVGFGYTIAVSALDEPLVSRRWAWAGFWIMLLGEATMLAPVLAGNASVLYTFYPPLTADVWFYVGLVGLFGGSWIWAVLMIRQMACWKRMHAGVPVPLAMFAITATAWLWLWTGVGVGSEIVFQILPHALGLSSHVDPGLARLLFSLTLHAITYFWLLPAYIAYYVFVPAAAGGRLYSDVLARVAFIMFLLFSVPTGMHHLMMDPQVPPAFKFLQTVLTAMVVAPTLLTIFTIGASIEIGGRLRGGRGRIAWVQALPWERPMMLGAALSLMLLGLGGFGGLVNMSYAMNAMVHNTVWVTAHFHLILGGATILMYFAIAYEIWPELTGRSFSSSRRVRWQLLLWAAGVLITTVPWHVAGLLGEPRRVAQFDYADPAVARWAGLTVISLVGAAVMLVAAMFFVVNLIALGPRTRDTTIRYSVALNPPRTVPSYLNGFLVWNLLLLVVTMLAYSVPLGRYLFPWHGGP